MAASEAWNLGAQDLGARAVRPTEPAQAPPCREADDPEAGTTLVELLVALALLSLIALFIGQGIDAIRQMAPVGRRIEAAMDMEAAREHLRRTLGEAVADLGLAGGAPFDGASEALRFLAPADPILEIGGLNAVTLMLAPIAGGGFDMVERREVASGNLALSGSLTVLVSGVRSLRLRYGEAGPDGSILWRETWRQRGVLPALVSIELDFPASDRRRFAPLLVHPLASPVPPDRLSQSPSDEARGTLLPEG